MLVPFRNLVLLLLHSDADSIRLRGYKQLLHNQKCPYIFFCTAWAFIVASADYLEKIIRIKVVCSALQPKHVFNAT